MHFCNGIGNVISVNKSQNQIKPYFNKDNKILQDSTGVVSPSSPNVIKD